MGQIEINHTGSGGTVVLSSDGTDLLLGGSAVGGSPDLFAENYNGTSTLPSATGTNAVAIGNSAVASGSGGFASGNGATASGANSVALGRANTASGQNAFAFGFSNTASATYSVAIHGDATADETTAIGRNSSSQPAKAVTGQGAMALGGSYASGTDSFAAAIANNTSSYGATGANSVAMGYLSKCSGSYSTAIGRQAVNAGGNSVALGASGVDIASGGNFHVGIGTSVSIDTDYNAIGIGRSVTVNHDAATAIGYMAISSVKGQYSYSSSYFSGGGTAGRGNGCTYVLYAEGTDATPQVMTTTKTTAAADNQIAAPTNDTCIMFSGTIVAMQNGAQDQGGWEIKGLLKNDGGTTTLVNSQVNSFDTGNGWDISLYADDTNNALKVQCTGEASHNIRWVANIQTSEVTYA